MSYVEIREAIPDDADQILIYTKRIGGESDNLTFGAEGLPLTTEEEKSFLQNMQKDDHSVFYCAWKGNKIVGTGNLNGLSGRMNHRAEMGISVLKDEWNTGIGGMLTRRLIDYARQHGIKIINIEVRHDNNSSIHLAQKYGFKRIGTSPAFFRIDGEYIDFELLYLDLR